MKRGMKSIIATIVAARYGMLPRSTFCMLRKFDVMKRGMKSIIATI
jgi:hypothetical protein